MRQLNTWYYVAGVYDAATGSSLHIYVNGNLDDGTCGATVPASQVDLLVERERRTSNRRLLLPRETIDELRIYNRALSASEIQALMTAPL